MTERLESRELQSWRDEGLRYVIMKFASGPAGEDKMVLIPFRTIPGAEFYLSICGKNCKSVKIVETIYAIDLFLRFEPLRAYKEDAMYLCEVN